MDIDLLRKRAMSRGFTENEITDTIENYLNLNLIMVGDNQIVLVDG